MQGANLVDILSNTLNPQLTNNSYFQLSQIKNSPGFVVQLLYQIEIRQSALIYLKNMMSDHCQKSSSIPQADIEILKSSVLEALIRNICQKRLTPTMREIIFLLAGKYCPNQWPSIIPDLVNKLTNSHDFNALAGSVEALKAIFSVFGKSVTQEITLSNLCNKTILPLLSLASKLFQNFNSQTGVVLLGIFKIFSTTIYFHLPEVIILNIHNWMIFIKKILDIPLNYLQFDQNLYTLKKICLRILFRLYQRHTNIKAPNKAFAMAFHQKYTKSFLESLLLQVMSESQGECQRKTKTRQLQLTKLSLSCLAYIYRQNKEGAQLINQYREMIISLILNRYKLTNINKNYGSYSEFKASIQEHRLHLKEIIFSFLRSQAIPEEQSTSANFILSILFEHIHKSDLPMKELCLYIFCEMSTEIKYLRESIDNKMVQFIIQYACPLLDPPNHPLLRIRACNLIYNFDYLELPQEVLTIIGEKIYSCLLGNTQNNSNTQNNQNEKETMGFLQISACNAFNSLLRYDQIVSFVTPNVRSFLEIYTSILEVDTSVIRNLEGLLTALEGTLKPFSTDLIGLLLTKFNDFYKISKNPEQINNQYSNNNSTNYTREDEADHEQDEDEQQNCEDVQNNYENVAKACIASIRQILQSNEVCIQNHTSNELFKIVIQIFVDPQQSFIEEGFNILNLLLYKNNQHSLQPFVFLFRAIIYAIIGLPENLISELRNQNNNYSLSYADILTNICIEPDIDIIENSIGCLRNFACKFQASVLREQLNGMSNLECLFRTVKYVHENQSGKTSQTERTIILTIYVTLIQYQVLQDSELEFILTDIMKWMQMEEEIVCIQQNKEIQLQQQQNIRNGRHLQQQNINKKYVYSPLYLQILLISAHYYPNVTNHLLNANIILEKVCILFDSFKCDYEISRVLIGVSDLLTSQKVNDKQVCSQFLNRLPELVKRLCEIRLKEDASDGQSMDDEAEEQALFGHDENSHILGWQQSNQPTNNDMLLQKDIENQDEGDHDWEEEFNKFYLSPYDSMDQIAYLSAALKGNASAYLECMALNNQELLSTYITQAPPKTL